jgi:hypothetical protein
MSISFPGSHGPALNRINPSKRSRVKLAAANMPRIDFQLVKPEVALLSSFLGGLLDVVTALTPRSHP